MKQTKIHHQHGPNSLLFQGNTGGFDGDVVT